uniref:Uncharacterized protein n=1 Tax=Arundo donax TaxID=35708 RepID=A0A0A8ZEZ9_ARUDO
MLLLFVMLIWCPLCDYLGRNNK